MSTTSTTTIRYITVETFAKRHKVTRERVYAWLKAKRIAGAIMLGRDWIIPSGAKKPASMQRGRPKKTTKSDAA